MSKYQKLLFLNAVSLAILLLSAYAFGWLSLLWIEEPTLASRWRGGRLWSRLEAWVLAFVATR